MIFFAERLRDFFVERLRDFLCEDVANYSIDVMQCNRSSFFLHF